jgi:hypothetical protein
MIHHLPWSEPVERQMAMDVDLIEDTFEHCHSTVRSWYRTWTMRGIPHGGFSAPLSW